MTYASLPRDSARRRGRRTGSAQANLDAILGKPGLKRHCDRLMESFPNRNKELTAVRSAKEQSFGPPDADETEEAAS